jgi:hemerythrin
MAELKWRDSYDIGINFIDEDHKHLLNIMLDIKKEIETGDFSKTTMSLNDFIKEVKAHFSREETFLNETRYPGLRKHKLYHKELLVKIETAKDKLESMEEKKDIKRHFDSIARFVFDDILQGDINFKSYLEHEGHTDTK